MHMDDMIWQAKDLKGTMCSVGLFLDRHMKYDITLIIFVVLVPCLSPLCVLHCYLSVL